ncbi:CNGC15b-like protein [Tanacetum coccineum]|uniref:CNGC15b-like protein n=1 Tax=Tanacetum coccineum TaxID=301880 RepID=A0ABQ5DH41_9ASTR
MQVIYDKISGRSRGFGFVTMSAVEEVEEAVRKFNGYELDGRAIRVNSGPPPRREESSFGRVKGEGGPSGGGRSFDNTNRVYVGNLAWSVDNLALETLFREQGNVVEAKVVYDRESGRSRGFGFVTYSSADEVNSAIDSLNGVDLDGRNIRVSVAEAPQRRQWTISRFGEENDAYSEAATKFDADVETPEPDTSSPKTDDPKLRKKLSRVFSEDYKKTDKTILDPRGESMNQWNHLFLIAALISLAVDPLFFYLPVVGEDMCLKEDNTLKITLTLIRSIVDVFYAIKIYVRFRTAYVAPSSRLLGRGELILDSSSISERNDEYKDECVILYHASVLPKALSHDYALNALSEGLDCFLLAYQADKQFKVIGSMWYLLAIERQGLCWVQICDAETECKHRYFDCVNVNLPLREAWYPTSNVTSICADADNFKYGLVEDAVNYSVASANFLKKYCYCLWWGLRGLSSAGQELQASPFLAESLFCILIGITGLILFALLIGNMQQYLDSRTKRLEEYRVKRMDTEQWMHHRHLPHEMRERVRKHDLYKWITTRGVDEEEILKALPQDIRRDIKRYVCAELVRRVPLFDQMDERTIDAICERLKPVISTGGTCLVREGDPTNEMLFIMRGHLDSYTTGGGRSGFFNQCEIGPGDFCGEELLTWALDPRPSVLLLILTGRDTVISISGRG